MDLYTKRMLEFIDHLMKEKCMTQEEALSSIGFQARNIAQVRSGAQNFRLKHYETAIVKYDLDANYFFRKTASRQYKAPKTAKEHIEAALEKMKK